MKVLPVIDIRDALVVHAVAGERDHYAPLQSDLTACHAPLSVARALRERVGLSHLYLADLDAIEHRRAVNLRMLRELADDGFDLLVDAGTRDPAQARTLLEAGVHEVVVGLETMVTPDDLGSVLDELGPDRTVFSLDLQEGRPLRGPADWQTLTPEEIVGSACNFGIRRVLVLDLAAVGRGTGWPLAGLVQRLRGIYPGVRWTSGGGVRHGEDLETLAASGLDAALVGTAIHRGTIGPRELERFARRMRPTGDSR